MKTLNDFYRLFPMRPNSPSKLAAVTPATTAAVTAADPANDDALNANRYRPRDYGTGYGRSSGYAQDRSYTAGRGDRMLRVG
jgi:hypothetical protein